MRNARVLGYLAGALVVLLAAVLLAVRVWVNPNHYKGNLAAMVKESTGRDLQLPGDIKLSVVPWLALEVGPASLSNLPGFGEEPLLAFSHATFRIKLLPLLRRRLELSRIELDGLDLRLRRNEGGRGNWQDAPTSASPLTGVGAARSPHAFASFADVSIHDGRVSYEEVTVEHLNLETGSAAPHGDMPVSITFDVHRGEPSDAISVNAKFDVSADSTAQQQRLAAVTLRGMLNRPGEDRPIAWELTAPTLAANLAEGSARATAFALSYAGAQLSGSATATNLFEGLSLKGSLTLAPLVLREFAPRVGVSIPNTRDAKAWSQLSGSTDFDYASRAWALRNLRLQLDDTQVQGNLKYSAAEIPALKFDLGVDHIDLDRYRPLKGSVAGHDGNTPNPPGERAKPLAADGTLTAAAANFLGMEFTDLRITLASKDSVTHLAPIEAHMDGGRYSGDITLDDRGAVRSVSINEHLTDVDMARLLARGAQKGRVSGKATLSLKGSGRGQSVEALLKTLNGHFDADLTEGALEGIDLEYQRDRAQALLERTPNARNDTKRTQFDAFKTSAEITNGIAVTHDLTISTQALKVSGQGSANLSTKAIDFQLLASILQAPTKTLVDIPLKVTGTYADPAVKADIDSLATDQLKQKLKDILKKNGLQGLFGK
ncbi:MAG: AsmA family protein [Steroidobacteraceae bacterium]